MTHLSSLHFLSSKNNILCVMILISGLSQSCAVFNSAYEMDNVRLKEECLLKMLWIPLR